jgi:hypothetical protein
MNILQIEKIYYISVLPHRLENILKLYGLGTGCFVCLLYSAFIVVRSCVKRRYVNVITLFHYIYINAQALRIYNRKYKRFQSHLF